MTKVPDSSGNRRFPSLTGTKWARIIILIFVVASILVIAAVVWNYLKTPEQVKSVPQDRPRSDRTDDRKQKQYTAVWLSHENNPLGAPAGAAQPLTIFRDSPGAALSMQAPPNNGSQPFRIYAVKLYRGDVGKKALWETEIDGSALNDQPIEVRVPRPVFQESGTYTLLLTGYRDEERRQQQATSTRYRINVILV